MVKRICSRCQVMNSPESGRFDLFVQSVRLGHDQDFECQVLPGPKAKIKVPLRASVHVDIQGTYYTINHGGIEPVLMPPFFPVPPKNVLLEKPVPRRAGSPVSVACTAEDSNPRTSLVWFREGSRQPILDTGRFLFAL